jgi:protein-S-isoprenylcysteine O-methyltransferase Ste14
MPQSVYQFMRHPIYLSFLGLVWFVPVVTLDRAVLIGVWTVYIYVGSVLNDSRLLFCVGDEYRSCQPAVPLGAALITR